MVCLRRVVSTVCHVEGAIPKSKIPVSSSDDGDFESIEIRVKPRSLLDVKPEFEAAGAVTEGMFALEAEI